MINNILEEISKEINNTTEKSNYFISTEKVLLSALNNKEIEAKLLKYGSNLQILKNILNKRIEIQKVNFNYKTSTSIVYFSYLERILAYGKDAEKTENISFYSFILGIYKISTEVLYLMKHSGFIPEKYLEEEMPVTTEGDPVRQETKLSDLLVDMVEEEKKNKKDNIIGRDIELSRMIQILSRRNKNNPLLVGEPGTGKSSIVNGLVQAIINKDVPEELQRAKVYSFSVGDALVGTKFRGEFEENIKKVLDFLKTKTKEETPILFIDEIHTILGAGNPGDKGADLANMLKPYLIGDIKCIGITTNDEYKKVFSKDKALVRRFQKINILEPTSNETIEILKGLKSNFEEFHKIKYPLETIKAAVDLSHKYLKNRFLPDKAFDVVDEVGALVKMKGSIKATLSDVEEIISQMAHIPLASIKKENNDSYLDLTNQIKSKLFGQDNAVEEIVKSIEVYSAGLTDQNKPIGGYLLVGPTGVGKTQLAKELAHEANLNFIRYDMSEYMDKTAANKFIGSSAGFVGYDEGGQLTEAIKKHPNSIILLDEIEKAHPEILNLFLQILDNASLTDSKGETVYFNDVLILMTSNIGIQASESKKVGLVGGAKPEEVDKMISKFFLPEFRNRLSGIIKFNSLNKESLIQIVKKQIKDVENLLSDKDIKLEISEEVILYLIDHGFDPKMGARPMARLINDMIKHPLASPILSGDLSKKGTVTFYISEDIVKYKIKKNQ
jgi:ATP-dependent Clp protease ATP-binding subunit ClpA